MPSVRHNYPEWACKVYLDWRHPISKLHRVGREKFPLCYISHFLHVKTALANKAEEVIDIILILLDSFCLTGQ